MKESITLQAANLFIAALLEQKNRAGLVQVLREFSHHHLGQPVLLCLLNRGMDCLEWQGDEKGDPIPIQGSLDHPLVYTLYTGQSVVLDTVSAVQEVASLLPVSALQARGIQKLAIYPVGLNATTVGSVSVLNPASEEEQELGRYIAALLGLALARLELQEIACNTDRATGEAKRQKRFAFPSIIDSPVMIGDSPVMQETRKKLSIAASGTASVLLSGETGVGKEVAARMIHHLSERRQEPFVSVNCSAIPEHLLESELFGHVKGAFSGAMSERAGLFMAADKGTLFLDELGDMPLPLQAKLLRALQESRCRPVGADTEVAFDVRIIAATHQVLQNKIAEKLFRHDLFYRLNGFPIDLPPLRARKEDVRLLLMHFAQEAMQNQNKKINGIAQDVISLLEEYDFPGNIREARNLITYAVLNCPEYEKITCAHLPPLSDGTHSVTNEEEGATEILENLVCAYEKKIIQQRLARHQGKKEKVAHSLGVTRRTLYSKISRYKIRE